MQPRRIVLILIILGSVCLPAPIYLSWAADATAPPPQTSQIYYAEPLDPQNETDREAIVNRHATNVALSIHQVSHRYSAGEYKVPNKTHQILDEAMQAGSATTDNPDVQADLRQIRHDYIFIYDAYGDDEQYYRLDIDENSSTVQATPVSRDRVANPTLEQGAYQYAELSTGEQRTVDRILANSSTEADGFRPRVNDPFVDQLPAVVYKDGTLYSIVVYGHVDDFGSGFAGFVVGVAVAGLGILLLLAGTVVYAGHRWRIRQE